MTQISSRARNFVLVMALAGTATAAFAQNAAVVNGSAIPDTRVDAFVKAMVAQGRPDTPEMRTAIREELIARELFVQEANKRALEKQPDVENQLIRAQQDILIGALIRDTLEKDPVTDEQIDAAYKEMSAAESGSKEYKARHILVETEEEAKKIIGELDSGKDFASLASVSKDPGSAAKGGDLDWNTAATFAPEFAAAMTSLEKGKFSSEPVKTQYGYHVIQLDDTRTAEPPPIDSVKPQIKQQLERQRVVDLQKSLRDAAKVE